MAQPISTAAIEHLLAEAVKARSAGDLPAAEQLYQQIVSREPAHAGALHNLGVIAALAGRPAQAVGWYERALQARPDAAETHSNLGVLYKDLGDTARAIRHLSEALRLRPGYAAAHNNLGVALMADGDAQGALDHFRRAVESNPGDGVAWCNVGRAVLSLRGPGAALEPLRRAVAAVPGLADAHSTLGAALWMLGRGPEAAAALARTLELRPGQVEVLADLVYLRQQMCDWTRLNEDAARVREYVAHSERSLVSPFSFMVLPGTTALEQKLCAERYARDVLARRKEHPPFVFSRESRRRLRIGYLHAHFEEHATVHLSVGVLERHDRSRFEIVGFQYQPDPVGVPGRGRRALDDLVDLSNLSDEEAARAIHARGIDILIDGQGYTRGARPGILARRPAPVQAAYLVYPGTTGSPCMDYLIADRFVIPPGSTSGYTETIKYLPATYQCNDDRRETVAPPSRGACGLPEKGFVFCCFNQTYKITPDVFDVWCRLLHAVPGSVLWLWASTASAPGNLRREAQARGMDPARLVFAPVLPPALHWARIGLADLSLDTFPCTAHTTASDALWAGVPLVTRCGETFVSRVAGSVLHAIGLPELITGSLAEYEAAALRLARDPAMLSGLRARLAANRATFPLFDTARQTRDLEAVYEEMWREWFTLAQTS